MTACDCCEQPRKAILEGGSCCYARNEMMRISNLSRKSNLSAESMRSLSKIMVINRPLDTATIVNAFMIRQRFYFLPKQIDHQSRQLFFVYSSRCWLVGIQRRRKEMWVHPRLMPCFRFGQLSAWLEGYRMQPRTPRMWSLTQIQMKGDTQWQSSETRHVKWGASWNIWMNLITMVHLQFYQLLYL